MNWVEIVVSILSGLAVCIPLVVQLVNVVRASVKEKNWSQIMTIVLDLMKQAVLRGRGKKSMGHGRC